MEWREGDYAYFNPEGLCGDPPMLVQLIEQSKDDFEIWKVNAIDHLNRSDWGGWTLGEYNASEQTFWTTDDLIAFADDYSPVTVDVTEFL